MGKFVFAKIQILSCEFETTLKLKYFANKLKKKKNYKQTIFHFE
jgi:hypothetical protein